jgi:hypothetical protein
MLGRTYSRTTQMAEQSETAPKTGNMSAALTTSKAAGRVAWFSSRLLRAPQWIIRNPLYAMLAVVALLLIAPVAWRVTGLATLVVWPPSITGSWISPEDSHFSLTLTEHDRRITGVGTVAGDAVSVSGLGTGRAADLTLKSGNSEYGVTTTMPDRNTLLLTFHLSKGDGFTWHLERR